MTATYAGRYAETALRTDGQIARGVPVTVYPTGSGMPAMLYADRDRSALADNPVIVDPITGQLDFWTEPGLYDLVGPGVELRAVPVGGDPDDYAPADPNGRVPFEALPIGSTARTIPAADDPRLVGAEQTSRRGQPGGYAALDADGLLLTSQIPGSGAPVTTVAGRTGAVVLTEADIAGLVEDLAARQVISALGQPGGYAALDAAGTVPVGQLPVGSGPATVAAGNDPRLTGVELAAHKGQPGGYAALGSDGRVPVSQLPVTAVTSVAGRTGDIALVEADVAGLPADLAARQNVAAKGTPNGYAALGADGLVPSSQLPAIPVSSVAGRTGAVTLVEADVAGLPADLAGKQNVAAKGTPNGYAGLDSSARVPVAQLPIGTGAGTVAAGTVDAAASTGSLRTLGIGPAQAAVGSQAVTSPQLAAWRGGLGNRLYGPVSAVCIGSSTTAGYNATARTRRYTDQVGVDLHARYNPPGVTGGVHILATDTGWTVSGSHGTDGNGLGLASVTLTASASMSRTEAGTGFDVHFVQGPNSGAFTVAVDGGSGATITPDTAGTADRHDGIYISPVLSFGSHSITITASTATVINGIYVRGGDEISGIRIYTSGAAGTTAASWAGASPSLFQRLAALSPRLVTIMLGANDFAGGVSPTAFQANLQTLINAVAGAVTPTPSILVIATYLRLDVSGSAYPWSAYTAAMAAVAAAHPGLVDYLDISGVYPTSQASDQASLLIDPADFVHQTDRGHRTMADQIIATLTAPAPPAVTLPPFDPRQVAGLLTWLDAGSLGLADGTAAGSWTPSAGLEAAALTQATVEQRPVYRTGRVNGRPALVFTAASNHNLDSGVWAGKRAVPLTVIAIAKIYTGNTGNLFTGRSGTYAYAGISTGTTLSAGAGAVSEINQGITLDTWHVIAVLYNSGASAIYLDSRTATVTGTTGTGASAALPGLRLGTNSGANSNWYDGEMAELTVYGRALSGGELAALMSWYGTRYGITIS
ncbi:MULTISPECIES: GDSL-type esterase/lipase family protein [Frankia]|uniref:GDSL-type esterase/lipase family protein n=1 Tax=Frankia TaxID=1854 RepID=UPI00030E27CC|nr:MULTISPECIES: GDSL-type esterase/lipase family protein [Frankia]